MRKIVILTLVVGIRSLVVGTLNQHGASNQYQEQARPEEASTFLHTSSPPPSTRHLTPPLSNTRPHSLSFSFSLSLSLSLPALKLTVTLLFHL